MIFTPRIPANVIIKELRDFCDEAALALLTKHIEGEAGQPDMILSTKQKQRYLDLWSCVVLCFGATEREGATSKLCAAANFAKLSADTNYAGDQMFVVKMLIASKHAEDRGRVFFNGILDEAFGAGSFDHDKLTKAFPGPDLGMCVRYAAHLMNTHKVKL